MIQFTRKNRLWSLISAMALAALFTACGDDSSSGVDDISVEPGESSSSSVVSGAAPDVTPGSSPSVTSAPVPGSSSSSSEVKPAGYYETNCPAGFTCRYAATTEYLNSTKTYGEILDTRDGQVYKTIVICDKDNKNCQTWMAQNLNYAPTNVSSMGDNAWNGCYGDGGYVYSGIRILTNEEVAANCSKYGRLYTWEVAMDNADCAYGKKCNALLKPVTPVRGVCPQGWHLPSHYEFEELINFIDPTFDYNHTDDASSSTAGLYLKSLSGWNSSGNGSDTYGFSAFPGGARYRNGDFNHEGNYATFWSSGEKSRYHAFFLSLNNDSDVELNWSYRNNARSVRCLKD